MALGALGGGAWAALDAREAQLLVSRASPHTILQATPAWLGACGYTEQEVLGRSVIMTLHGDGTCMSTAGALWTALQARTHRSLAHPAQSSRGQAAPRSSWPGRPRRDRTGKAHHQPAPQRHGTA
jgi:hypothetical protein